MEVSIKLDSIDWKVAPSLAQAINSVINAEKARADAAEAKATAAQATATAETARADAAEAKVATVTAQVATETARADAAEAKATTLEGQRLDSAAIAAAVKARTELLGKASAIVDAKVNLDELDDTGIKTAVVAHVYPTIALDGKPEGYLEAMFDRAVADAPKLVDASAKGAKAAVKARTDAAPGDAATQARAKQRQDSAEAWKQPIGVTK
ncbi:hypothetical protein D3C72_718810 [compost metagenome]